MLTITRQLVIKETKTKAISAFMVPNTGVQAVADFMSGCGCGRAIPKSVGEPAIVALQEAVKNSRQRDTFLENAPKGDSQSKWSSRQRCEGGRRNGTHVEDVFRE